MRRGRENRPAECRRQKYHKYWNHTPSQHIPVKKQTRQGGRRRGCLEQKDRPQPSPRPSLRFYFFARLNNLQGIKILAETTTAGHPSTSVQRCAMSTISIRRRRHNNRHRHTKGWCHTRPTPAVLSALPPAQQKQPRRFSDIGVAPCVRLAAVL